MAAGDSKNSNKPLNINFIRHFIILPDFIIPPENYNQNDIFSKSFRFECCLFFAIDLILTFNYKQQ